MLYSFCWNNRLGFKRSIKRLGSNIDKNKIKQDNPLTLIKVSDESETFIDLMGL